ncbi:Glycosyltransferase family 92 protein [Caenorhabditis elegans]|uniref:Glycosyltransferase family 92 protein n=1 Tax=Caenorhabditis elegans TaxID=6239 RepID=O16900_CAEEL|nr:Glycosyltransferase family 92 protein [Caenorhabditis elegans]CCD66297.1 Glycosyltransferase family 92 protein [Caenorhabditis elegans]|eukprot:NP_503789.1 Uncharacterized protein CELE_C31B8.7 [Caenorhabditis elegans]
MLNRNTAICLIALCFISFLFMFSRNTCNIQEQYGISLLQLPFFSNSTESLKNISGLVSLQPEYVEPLTPRPTPSKEEVPDSGDDEVVGGESAMSYFKKLSGSIKDFINSRSGSGEKINVLAAYSYKDHFSATISIPKKIGTIAYCRYVGADGKEVAEPVLSQIYPFFVVYCSRRNNVTTLGITGDKNELISTENSVKLIRRKFKEYQHNVSFCLAPIYGKEPKWLHFVELVEHYKLQGVNKFFIYIREINEYDRKLIDSYVESGEVEIIDIPGTVADVIAQQLMAVADCLLRSRTFSKWSIYADIDERLIMTDDRITIDGFLRTITDETIGSIAFPQRWIMKRDLLPAKFENDEQVIETMPTRAWHETTSAALKGHPVCNEQQSCWAKDIVHNEKAIRMLVHEVETFYPGFRELFLDPSIGYIRHYRDVTMQSWEHNNVANLKKFGPFSNTTYPPTIGSKLLKNVFSRLHRVYN